MGRTWSIAQVAAVLVLACWCAASVRAQDSASQPASKRRVPGAPLSADQVRQLEEKVKLSPNDSASREELLAHYSRSRFNPATTPAEKESRIAHVLWIIDNKPESDVAGHPDAAVDRILEAAAYQRARDLWIKQVDGAGKANPKVLANAANFFLLHDRARAEALLKRAIELDPKSAGWATQLGHLYALGMWGLRGTPDPEIAKRSLAAYELALSTADDASRGNLLEELATVAAYAGDLAKAEQYAKEALERAVEPGGAGWNYGNAVHHGNLVLGLVALKKDDLNTAEKHLLKAGETSGSPQLNSFGPNMYLAQELLKQGRQATVIQYLKLCKKFWSNPSADRWIADIEAGRKPDFGGNLRY